MPQYQPLYAPALGRPAPVVRDGGDIPYQRNIQTARLNGTNGGFATGPGPVNIGAHFAQSHVQSFLARLFRRQLRREGRTFSGTGESNLPRTGPRYYVSLCISDGNNGIVEARQNMGNARGNIQMHLAFFNLAFSFFFCHVQFSPEKQCFNRSVLVKDSLWKS